MDYESLVIGIGCFYVTYLIYYWIKDEKSSSALSLSNLIKLWSCVIMGIIAGIIFILKSLPNNI
jgi:hypothetical protein